MSVEGKVYLGDGLYVEDRGYMIELTTHRAEEGLHWVALEDEVLQAFIDFVGKTRGLKITVEKLEPG